VAGFTLGQSYGSGRTQQSTLIPGQGAAGPAPAAGANYVFSVRHHDRVRLVFCAFTLATDATAGNRYVTVAYQLGASGASYADAAAVTVTPSTTSQRFIGSINRGVAEWNTGTDVLFPLGGPWLEIGSTVTINVGGIGTGDQLSAIYLTFDRTFAEGELAAAEYAAEQGNTDLTPPWPTR
jgi:hypothetical protein